MWPFGTGEEQQSKAPVSNHPIAEHTVCNVDGKTETTKEYAKLNGKTWIAFIITNLINGAVAWFAMEHYHDMVNEHASSFDKGIMMSFAIIVMSLGIALAFSLISKKLKIPKIPWFNKK